MKKKILEISNLEASIGKKKIIKNFNLTIEENQIHIIMGPNGSGKSTLSKILAGHPSYLVEKGTILYCGENLVEKEIDLRAKEGLFLAFQYPLEISGVTNYDFLRSIYNQKQKHFQKPEVDPIEFMGIIQPFVEKLKMNSEFLNRNLNEGFSGGEKKRNEILQMLLVKPKLLILDEIDSGLDIDAIKTIFEAILTIMKDKDNETIETSLKSKEEFLTSILVITHNPKILNYLSPDYVHIMIDGKIRQTGNLELVEAIEEFGYEPLKI
jgi:Fe-S cluster assembly ATP-binding protein